MSKSECGMRAMTKANVRLRHWISTFDSDIRIEFDMKSTGDDVNHRSLCRPWEHQLSRRQWLGSVAGVAGAAALGGLFQPAIADELKKKHKQVLFIWLDGGMSQLESWDPKPNTQFGGPFRADPDQRAGHPRQRAAAADGEADAPPGGRPQPVHAGQLALGRRGPHPARRSEEPRRDVSVLRLGRRQAARARRQRPAALRLDQARQRRLHPPGRRLPRPEVRRAGLRRRQAAGEPAAAGVAHASRTTTPATSCASG